MQSRRLLAFIAVLLASFLLVSCAKQTDNSSIYSRNDPFEPFNRSMFKFNMLIDNTIMRPVAKGYEFITPAPVNKSISNVFSNLSDVTSAANSLLQLKISDFMFTSWRVFFNTTVGLGGIFDISSYIGIPKNKQDFGLTLARWGWRQQPYLMIPFLGPSTPRDAIGWGVDTWWLSPWTYIEPRPLRYGLYALDVIDTRADLLPADKLIDEAFDPYVFVRDAYFQQRENKIDVLTGAKSANGDDDDVFVEGDDTDTTADENSQTEEKPKADEKATAQKKKGTRVAAHHSHEYRTLGRY